MKFFLIKLQGVPKKEDNGESEHWRLIIDNKEDLDVYHNQEARSYANALLSMATNSDSGQIETTHIRGAATKEIVLARWLNLRQQTAKESEKIYPLFEMTSLVDRKYLSQLKYISNHGAIQINTAGGWCDLDGFLKTWDGEIKREIFKETCAFPTSDWALTADTICLENSHPDYGGIYLKQSARGEFGVDAGTIEVIYNLREVDTDWIKKSVLNAKNIYISTQVQDSNQLDLFMYMFENMPRKNIFIQVYKQQEKGTITSHSKYAKVNEMHNIKISIYQ